MTKRSVYLVQVNWSNCAGNTAGFWIPYSIGSLWAYAMQFADLRDSYQLTDILFWRRPIAQVVDQMTDPDVVGFSTYVWNEQYNLALAREVRKRWPEVLVVFGGPQVPIRRLDYLAQHPFIDVLVHHEGEAAFTALLRERARSPHDYAAVPGCTVRQAGGIVRTEPARRLMSLDSLASPYLTGVFDDLFSQYPDATWNAVMETNRGCPYRCTFCDWGTLTYSKMTKVPLDRVLGEIEWLAQHGVSYVMPADSNFGIFPERDLAIVDAFVSCHARFGCPSAVGMNFAKHSNQRLVEMAARLHTAGLLKGLTVSMQSMSPTVLEAIQRVNLASNRFGEILGACNRRGIPTYTELILGLPNETYASWKTGLCDALECGQHSQLESWLLELLENAPLNDPSALSRFGMKTVRLRNYCFVFDWKEREEISELVDIVYETSSMPYEDFQRSIGFSMIIYNCHAYGWTQFLSRYLRHVQNVTYYEFYSLLEKWIRDRPQSLLGGEYERTVETFRMMVEKGDYFIDWPLLSFNLGAVPLLLRSQGFLHLEPERAIAEVADFSTVHFGSRIGSDLAEVLRFQEHFVTSPHRTYPYEATFRAGFAEILTGGNFTERTTVYRFDTVYAFRDVEDYVQKLYARKKQGFGKALLRNMTSPCAAGLSRS
jgi:putative methyltransferase